MDNHQYKVMLENIDSKEKMMSILEFPIEHFFSDNEEYYQGFMAAFQTIYGADLDSKEAKKILKDKYFCGDKKLLFNKDQFIQYACELPIGAYYKRKWFTVTPELEIRGGSEKNVDWQVNIGLYKINLEVKCSVEEDPIPETDGTSDIIQLISSGRLADKDSITKLKTTLSKDTKMEVLIPKNADNRLKDYLIEANNKFEEDPDINTLNILVVGLGHFYNLKNWKFYLLGNQGLFTNCSFEEKAKYKNVDGVLLTSMRYGHQYQEARRKQSWDFEHSFNFFYLNPYKRKNLVNDTITAFLGETPNFNEAFKTFKPKLNQQFLTGDVLNELTMLHFYGKYLSKEQREYYWPNNKYILPDK